MRVCIERTRDRVSATVLNVHNTLSTIVIACLLAWNNVFSSSSSCILSNRYILVYMEKEDSLKKESFFYDCIIKYRAVFLSMTVYLKEIEEDRQRAERGSAIKDIEIMRGVSETKERFFISIISNLWIGSH